MKYKLTSPHLVCGSLVWAACAEWPNTSLSNQKSPWEQNSWFWNPHLGKGWEPSSEIWAQITAGPWAMCAPGWAPWQLCNGSRQLGSIIGPRRRLILSVGTAGCMVPVPHRTKREKSKGFNLFSHSSILLCSEGNLLVKRYCRLITSHSLHFTHSLWRMSNFMTLKNSILIQGRQIFSRVVSDLLC